MKCRLLLVAGMLFGTCAFGQEAVKNADPKPLTDAKWAWKDFLTDSSSGAVTAAGMLGVSGENVTTIDNVRSLVVALPSLGSSDSGQTVALSITPARTSITPMSLQSYADSFALRLLGSLTLSYANGPVEIENVNFKREAWAIDTNAFLFEDDDVLIAYAKAFKTENPNDPCSVLESQPPDNPPTKPVTTETNEGPPMPAAEAQPEIATESIKRADECKGKVEKAVSGRWNRSQLSISYGDARIRIKDNSKQRESLGRTFAASLVLGFPKKNAGPGGFALTANYRRSEREPVLNTLSSAQTVFKDSSLFVAQLKYGNDSTRVFFELSDARSHDITASQRAFKRALGIDIKAFEGTWLNLRVGRQRSVNGTTEETGSLLSVTYSPKALL